MESSGSRLPLREDLTADRSSKDTELFLLLHVSVLHVVHFKKFVRFIVMTLFITDRNTLLTSLGIVMVPLFSFLALVRDFFPPKVSLARNYQLYKEPVFQVHKAPVFSLGCSLLCTCFLFHFCSLLFPFSLTSFFVLLSFFWWWVNFPFFFLSFLRWKVKSSILNLSFSIFIWSYIFLSKIPFKYYFDRSPHILICCIFIAIRSKWSLNLKFWLD